MPMPEKPWFRVAEVAERWDVRLVDVEDYALDERLQLAVLVVGLPAEKGRVGTDRDGAPLMLPESTVMLDGPQPLLRRSLVEIVRAGQAEVYSFASEQGYLRLLRETPPRLVRRDELIVTRAERDRFEREHGVGPRPAPAPTASAGDAPVLQQEADFRVLHFRGQTWHLGPMQASVVRQLHEAWRSGQHWVSGKVVLSKAGASSMRMRDLFKAHPGWRTLLLSDGRGQYRLNLPVERIRLFRMFHDRAVTMNDRAKRTANRTAA